MSWRNIEPVEGVLTELLELLEVKGVEVEELHPFEMEKVINLWPIYGVILFYSCEPMEKHDAEYPITNLFFARQAHNNTCATQALLSVVMNCPELDIGPKLSALKESAKDLSPDLKGQAILNDEALRSVHNEFAPEDELTSEEEDKEVSSNAVNHFVSYLSVDGILYELDGLAKGPISLGEFKEFGEKGWLELLQPLIEERVDHYADRDIKYSLMAVIKYRMAFLLADHKELDKEEEGLNQRIKEVENKISVVTKLVEEAEFSYSQSPTAIVKARIESCRTELQGFLAEKEALEKHEKMKKANRCRKRAREATDSDNEGYR